MKSIRAGRYFAFKRVLLQTVLCIIGIQLEKVTSIIGERVLPNALHRNKTENQAPKEPRDAAKTDRTSDENANSSYQV